MKEFTKKPLIDVTDIHSHENKLNFRACNKHFMSKV